MSRQFPPHDPNFPDVDPETGDERATTTGEARDSNPVCPLCDAGTHVYGFNGACLCCGLP